MNTKPGIHVRGEIRRIAPRPGGSPEVLLRVSGRSSTPDDPRTFIHLRVVDRLRRTTMRRLGPGAEVTGTIIMTARFLEDAETPARTLEINGRTGSGRLPQAIRVVAYDTRIAGEVVRHLDHESFVMDAGIPLLVRVPGPSPRLPPPGQFVEFLLHEPPVAEFL
jgi:hypothetical protein